MPTQDAGNPTKRVFDLLLDKLGIPNSPGKVFKDLISHMDELNPASDKYGTPDFSTRIDDIYEKDGYRQNPADENWYEAPPNPQVGDYGWRAPASTEKQTTLDKWQRYAKNYNSVHDLINNNQRNNSAINSAKNNFGHASTIPSPIILDLDNDGIETTAVKSGAYFDHAADGFAEQTGWAGADDGLLVRDLDGNGLIDSGRELFGSETLLNNGSKAANGFAALAELDGNHDGKLDSTDAAFATLKVWKDADGDGYSAEGELLTLSEAGVQSLNVAYTHSTQVDANGNAHKQLGSYTTTTGATRAATDVWFQTDPTYSIASDWLDVPEAIAALPDATGYGKVHDLHQAMARDPGGKLQALVTQFTQATSASKRESLLQSIIYYWAGVLDVNPDSRAATLIYGNAIGDARKLEALEQFMGQEWYGVWCWGTRDPNPHGQAAPILLQAWDELAELVYGQLMAQSHLKPLYDQVGYAWDDARQTLVGDLSQVAAALAVGLAANRTTGLAELAEFARTLKGMGALNSLDTAGFQETLASLGSDATGILNAAWSGLVATNGNDSFTASGNGDFYLRGLAGNDSLTTQGGNDTLTGHSLGGALAQLQAAQTGLHAETFNPYGAKTLIPALNERYGLDLDPEATYSNITNHRTLFDGVSQIPGSAQLGEMNTHIAASELVGLIAVVATRSPALLAVFSGYCLRHIPFGGWSSRFPQDYPAAKFQYA